MRDRLPLTVDGACPLVPARHRLEIPSAQVKSALLLAALNTPGITDRRSAADPRPSRADAASVRRRDRRATARAIALRGEAELQAAVARHPRRRLGRRLPRRRRSDRAGLGDPDRGRRRQPDPDRPLRHAARDGRRHRLREPTRAFAASRSPTWSSATARCAGIDVPAEIAPRMIDEYPDPCSSPPPSRAGRPAPRGLAELRLKESDRIAAMAPLGAREEGDGLAIAGTRRRAARRRLRRSTRGSTIASPWPSRWLASAAASR